MSVNACVCVHLSCVCVCVNVYLPVSGGQCVLFSCGVCVTATMREGVYTCDLCLRMDK